MAIKHVNAGDLPRYNREELQALAKKPLQGVHASINRLKAGNPEAYYFWLCAIHG